MSSQSSTASEPDLDHRIRRELMELLESEQMLETSWRALQDEYRADLQLGPDTHEPVPSSWLDRENLLVYARGLAHLAILAALGIMGLTAIAVLARLASTDPLTPSTTEVGAHE